jgi:type I restriction enzyme, S subunit
MSDVPLSALAEVNPAVRIPRGLVGSAAVSFIPMSDVSESGQWTWKQTRTFRSIAAGFTAFEDGDILVAKITPCMENGKGAHATGLQSGIGFGSTEFHILRAKPGADSRFIFQLTQWRNFRKAAESQMVGSAGQRRVPRQFLEEFPIARFSIAEQTQIAEILDTLDTAIHETEAIIAKLKSVKQGLLHDLLTRGIAANGELRATQAEAPHLYKDSALGWIPKEWDVQALGQMLAEPTRNGLYKSSQFHGGGPLMLQMGGMFVGEAADFHTATRVRVNPSELHNFGLMIGDLLFARRSLVFEGAGLCVIVRSLPGAATFESSIVRARVVEGTVHPEFVCQFLRGESSKAQRRTLIRQVAVSGVSSADIRQFLIAKPALAEQTAIVESQGISQERIDHEIALVAKLRRQKSGLMDDLLTGRVRVTPLLEGTAP